mmetsp:Transcript_13318/g.37389  ORF Transcript_13318/g.37389 Transcript_13318/m.37389 type:complete len:284 (+) Transcript_13318:2056-2907(+)
MSRVPALAGSWLAVVLVLVLAAQGHGGVPDFLLRDVLVLRDHRLGLEVDHEVPDLLLEVLDDGILLLQLGFRQVHLLPPLVLVAQDGLAQIFQKAVLLLKVFSQLLFTALAACLEVPCLAQRRVRHFSLHGDLLPHLLQLPFEVLRLGPKLRHEQVVVLQGYGLQLAGQDDVLVFLSQLLVLPPLAAPPRLLHGLDIAVGGHLHQIVLAIHLAPDQPVDVLVAHVVPHPLALELHGVAVPRLQPMGPGVPPGIPPATHVATNDADPQVLSPIADLALRSLRVL